MTSHQFIDAGDRLVLPSGQTATFIRWRARPIKVGDAGQGQERVAVVFVDGLAERTEFSARFMEKVRVCPQ